MIWGDDVPNIWSDLLHVLTDIETGKRLKKTSISKIIGTWINDWFFCPCYFSLAHVKCQLTTTVVKLIIMTGIQKKC
jgi:hypothetical protein